MTTDGRLSMDEIEETLKKCRKQIFYIESLERLRAEIEEQMGSVKGTDYSRPRVSSSNISDLGAKVEAAWDKLQALDEKVAAALETQAALRLDALDLIERCDNTVQMAVLSWYYIHGYSWEAVARKINYEDKYVFRIRNAGLEAIERNARATIK